MLQEIFTWKWYYDYDEINDYIRMIMIMKSNDEYEVKIMIVMKLKLW